MKDINEVEMKTGDIVEIRNAYFKNDNGIYFVAHTPNDVSWCGKDYSLTKMCKNGKISTNSRNIAFWPLCAFTNNSQKNTECHEWNKEHATIEIIYNIDNSQVIEHFKQEVEVMKQQTEYNSRYYGENEKCTNLSRDIYNLYIEVVARMEKKEETEVKEDIKPIEQQIKEDQTEAIAEVETVTKEQTEETPTHEQPQQEITTTIERKYYPINEQLAKTSKSLWSFNDYIPNSATESYKSEVEKAYKVVDRIAQEKPDRLQDALTIAERFSKAYADWKNKEYSIEMMCPSVMICGAGNFPVRKKEKQNAARDKHMKDFEYINGYLQKLENILHGNEIIKSGDKDAIEKLTDKLKQLEESQELMKQVNTYYRKNNTLDGCNLISQKTINTIKDIMTRIPYHTQPFASYELTNNNASIKATKQRLEALQKVKEEGTKETIQSEICQVVENSELMRIQLLFDSIPDVETRSILKSNGFKWSPTNKAWQRQLTDNARYSTKKVIEQLEKLSA
jgi:hypothetical protein